MRIKYLDSSSTNQDSNIKSCLILRTENINNSLNNNNNNNNDNDKSPRPGNTGLMSSGG